MRNQFALEVERRRVRQGQFKSWSGQKFGLFYLDGPCGMLLRCLVSDGVDAESHNWEHVSVSLENRTPNWTEMCFVKNAFWEPEETVIQYHPPQSKYVNTHANVLHLWRHRTAEFPMPPIELV